mgnify:CR=1 FL=1
MPPASCHWRCGKWQGIEDCRSHNSSLNRTRRNSLGPRKRPVRSRAPPGGARPLDERGETTVRIVSETPGESRTRTKDEDDYDGRWDVCPFPKRFFCGLDTRHPTLSPSVLLNSHHRFLFCDLPLGCRSK